MSTLGNQSSQMILTIQTKTPTYTPEIFNRTITELGYVGTPTNAQISTNPNAPPVPTVLFSKNNIMVLTNYGENLIRFVIINTLDLNAIYTDISQVLDKLQIGPTSINITDFMCKTEIPTADNPSHTLTNTVNQDVLKKISSVLNTPGMTILNITLSNTNWNTGEFKIILEPLMSDPENKFWMIIGYRTTSLLEFNKFIETFNSNTVEGILRALK